MRTLWIARARMGSICRAWRFRAMAYPELSWLPEAENWRERIAALASFDELQQLARTRLDFVRTNALDQILRRRWPQGVEGRRYRLALLSSSTTAPLAPALRVAGL